MGLLSRLFGKQKGLPKKHKSTIMLAFVLLSEARFPDADETTRVYGDFALPEESISVEADKSNEATQGQALSLRLSTGETGFVLPMPAAIPDHEADKGAQFSVSSIKTGWTLPPHSAHLVVTLNTVNESQPLTVQLSRFTSVVAAVAKASPSVGVYWGDAGATHDSEFFVSVAADTGIVPRIMLWSGVSVAREKDGRLSLLSLGMQQLHLPDLLLVTEESTSSVALEMMFDLLAYVAERGEAPPEGDTVGRSANERLRVHYVKSPVESARQVWRVELP